jgi:ribonuclease VapC
MGSLVLLDTSALLTLRDDEPGAARVEEALEQPGRCYACFLSRMEVLYRVWKDEDERAGRLAYEQLKARHSLSLADAWIAAAAQQVGANLPQEWLG